MKKEISVILSVVFFAAVCMSCSSQNKKVKEVVNIEIKVRKELVTFSSKDELTVTGDLYTIQDKDNGPFIILFHQAGYSRGEYKETAEKFIELGYNCLAIDQRSGNEVNGVVNQTHKEAVVKGLPTEYTDAMPDLLAAIEYIKDNFKPEKLLIMGSSYSATLSLIIAAQNPDMVNGVLAFSPGEYFEYNETTVLEYAGDILVPVFITSAKGEYENWKDIFEAIPNKNKQQFIPEVESIHGSRALWETTEGNKECWNAVEEFLSDI